MKKEYSLLDIFKLVSINTIVYSFLVYNNSTVTYFNTQFILNEFSDDHKLIYLTYASVTLSFFMRILGSVFLGSLGDKYGRSFIIRICSIGSSAPLIIIVLIPSHNPYSLELFIILMAIQGFFTGGLSGGVNVIGIENLPENYRGLFSGIGMSVGGFSYLIMVLVYSVIVIILGVDNYSKLGWRISFLVSSLIIPFGFMIPESKKFKKEHKNFSPLKILFGQYKLKFLKCMIISGIFASLNLSALAILPNFLYGVNGFSSIDIRNVMLIFSIFAIIFGFMGGQVSQFIGRRKTFILGSFISLVFSFVYIEISKYYFINYSFYFYIIILSFITNFPGGGLMVFINENFPTKIRSTAVSLCWNLGFSIGGITTVISSYVSSFSNYINFPLIETIMIITLSILGIISVRFIEETKGNIEKF